MAAERVVHYIVQRGGLVTEPVPRIAAAAIEPSALRRMGVVLLVAVAYFAAGLLGLEFASAKASATAVWPPTGIALAAFLILGYRIWPAILVAAILASLSAGGAIASSIGFGVGSTLEGLFGAYLVNRLANGRGAFGRARDTFRFSLLAMLSTVVSPTIGISTVSAAGFAGWIDVGRMWITWWLGDAVGAIVIAPVFLVWSIPSDVLWTRGRVLECAAFAFSLACVACTVFYGLFPVIGRHQSLDFLCFPLLVWAAFRFGQREVAVAIVALALIATAGTLHGYGPFARESPGAALLLLQLFMGVSAIVSLALAAVVSGRKDVEAQIRLLAGSDPLTGLANHRQAIDVLESEIRRSQRTGRPLAVLFLDLDRLKRINDHHGHLVGNRALCRLAEALRASSRAIDTPARLGGDEFVLILPETGEERAWQVAKRLAEGLATDNERPALTVSVGVAVYPRDGDSVESLLGTADRILYDAKGQRGH